MSMTIDTVEGRLQLRIGQLTFDNEVLLQKLSEYQKEIEDLRAQLRREDEQQSEDE